MLKICVTRFNNKTFKQNERWKDRNGYTFTKRIYNTSVKIKPKISINSEVFVIEMNNDTNEFIAFSVLKNVPSMWKHKIYSDNWFNRYTYSTNEFIYFQEVQEKYSDELEILKRELFYGLGHLKRGTGIQEVPEKKIVNIRGIFTEIYRTIKDTSPET